MVWISSSSISSSGIWVSGINSVGSSIRKSIGDSWVLHGRVGSKDSRVSFSLALLSLSIHSRLFSSSSRGCNMIIGISVDSSSIDSSSIDSALIPLLTLR
eukprot:TRINITY_DN1340_c0_g1_i1.p1 TRINITY_DN1340_c0_g1~~TRINITY_DN1340_c0_g1_i1.p1  ORF type:complete len:100 (+),score=3.49 TRINITY_DN1340_c0_g1_i1:129-428(+)